MPSNELPEMTEEQITLFGKLTKLQRGTCLNILKGMNNTDAYKAAGGKAKNPHDNAAQIVGNHRVRKFIDSMQQQAARNALCTTEDIVKGLMREAGLGFDEKGNPLNPPEDAKQVGRVSALKALSDFTGGFDANRQQIEHSGYIETSLDELYGDD